MSKMRADRLLVRQGLAESIKKADGLIMAGKVFTTKEQKILTSGEQLKEEIELYVKGKKIPYVSRGGLKLKKAIDIFNIEIQGKTILDIGSSTGGFTDVSLQEGAKLVYALDVGTNQLAWVLRNDDRVVVMEQTNFRYSKGEDFQEGIPDLAVIDVSFISLELILRALKGIIKKEGQVVALIKPQFEAPRDLVGDKGVITDPSVHQFVLEKAAEFIQKVGFLLENLAVSPIVGGKGNVEFLAYLKENSSKDSQNDVENLINYAINQAEELK